MLRRTVLIVALAGALAVVPGAAAITIQMQDGDTIDILGTKLACFFIPSTKKQGIGCYQATNKGLVKGTYGIAISQTGDVIITRVSRSGGTVTLWGNRKKASARANGVRYFSFKKGDSFGFRVNSIDTGCNVLDLPSSNPVFAGRRVVCFRSINSKPIPNSYGVVISNKFVGSFRFDAKGRIPKTNAYVRLQPS